MAGMQLLLITCGHKAFLSNILCRKEAPALAQVQPDFHRRVDNKDTQQGAPDGLGPLDLPWPKMFQGHWNPLLCSKDTPPPRPRGSSVSPWRVVLTHGVEGTFLTALWLVL